jgi:EEF1A lysine methyltransferase 1
LKFFFTANPKVTNRKVVQTLRQILHPTKGKLFLITSTSIEDVLYKLYDYPPVGPLRKTSMKIEHDKLVNDFALWRSWDGAETLGMDTPVDLEST